MSSIYGCFTGSHSATVALMVDGKVVSVIEEERITRLKAGDNYDVNADLSLDSIQKYTGLKMTDVDYNVFALPTPDGFARKGEISFGCRTPFCSKVCLHSIHYPGHGGARYRDQH